jgi:hypothetical protein
LQSQINEEDFKINQVRHLESFEIKIKKFENLCDEDQTTGKIDFDQRIRLAQGSHAHSTNLKDLQTQKRKERMVITIHFNQTKS